MSTAEQKAQFLAAMEATRAANEPVMGPDEELANLHIDLDRLNKALVALGFGSVALWSSDGEQT